jgi:hypothetical protein
MIPFCGSGDGWPNNSEKFLKKAKREIYYDLF